MLSGETAAGKYPILAVQTMAKIAETTENNINYRKRFFNTDFQIQNSVDAVSHATCSMAINLNARAIVVCSLSGRTARMVSRFRPPVDIIGICVDQKSVRKLSLSWGVTPVLGESVPTTDVLFALCEAAKGETGKDVHVGVVQAKDSFYGQHRPAKMPTSAQLLSQWDAWKKLGVKASEMESGTLFVVGSLLRVRTGGVFSVVWNQERYDAGLDTDDVHNIDTEAAIRVAVEAIKLLIEQDKNK